MIFHSVSQCILSKAFSKSMKQVYKFEFHYMACSRILQASENVWKVLKVILWTSVQIWCNIVLRICIQRNHSPGLLRWSCLQTEEGQRWNEFYLIGLENSETPSTSSVWPNDHREKYRSCAWPLYSRVQINKRCTLTNKAVGTIWRALSKPP